MAEYTPKIDSGYPIQVSGLKKGYDQDNVRAHFMQFGRIFAAKYQTDLGIAVFSYD